MKLLKVNNFGFLFFDGHNKIDGISNRIRHGRGDKEPGRMPGFYRGGGYG
jgi:hypothetical protein